MKNMYILPIISALALAACAQDNFTIPTGSDAVVGESSVVKIIKNSSNEWTMVVNDSPYYVNGAAANRFYTDVKKFGGNTIRLYSPASSDTRQIMDDAYQKELKVYLGLGLAAAEYFDYTNKEKVAAQKEKIRTYIKQYKDHPALLCWSIGNEAEASNEDNIDLWKAIGDIAAMIKELDPNHPVTCTLASSTEKRFKNLVTYAPDIDFLSVNNYYPHVGKVGENISKAGIDLPYMVTEFGPRGTWAMSQEPSRILPWDDYYSDSSKALVEETSTEKEELYLKIWQEDIKGKASMGCIGSFVFVWGYQTHGEVLNWYSLYTTDRYTYGACDAMQYCWTGSWPEVRAPRIASRKDMTLDNMVAEDAIKIKVGTKHSAKVVAEAQAEVNLRYQWRIFKEGDKKSDGSMSDGIEGLIDENGSAEISFTAPAAAGAYRLYVFALDDVHKKAASACIPFYVE